MEEAYVFWTSDQEENLHPREDLIGKMVEEERRGGRPSHVGTSRASAASGSPSKFGAAKDKDKEKMKEPTEELEPTVGQAARVAVQHVDRREGARAEPVAAAGHQPERLLTTFCLLSKYTSIFSNGFKIP